MRRSLPTLPVLAFAAVSSVSMLTLSGCKGGQSASSDSALQRDLTLSTAPGATQVVSPEEQARRARHRTASAGNVATSSSPARSNGSGDVVVKHTGRDAAIGGAAGAVIGGLTHGVTGAVVGGVAGGVLGAVIGNNVDKQKKKKSP